MNLRKVKKKDLATIRDWRNSEGIREFNTQYIYLNMENQTNWFNSIQKNSDRIMFIITNKKKKPIGICGLIHLDKKNHNADVAIIIGNKTLHGKGYGFESLSLLVKFGFEQLNLHRIEAEIFEYNHKSKMLFKKLNFKYEVTLKESLWRNGKWWNIHLYSLLLNDYKKLQLNC